MKAKAIRKQIEQVLKVDEGGRMVSGYASVWGEVDAEGEHTVKGCFAKSLAEHGTARALFWAHNGVMIPVGVAECREDEHGLFFEAELSDDDDGRRLATAIRRKAVQGCSFGGWLLKAGKGGALEEIDLTEVSPCLRGSNPAAYVTASLEADEEAELRAELRALAAELRGPLAKSLDAPLAKSLAQAASALAALSYAKSEVLYAFEAARRSDRTESPELQAAVEAEFAIFAELAQTLRSPFSLSSQE